MNTKAVRIHGKNDLRLDEITLPEVGPDDVRIRVVSDSLCMSRLRAFSTWIPSSVSWSRWT